MKKAYSKPEIVFESFTLSTNIAGDCDIKTNTPSDGKCGVENNNGFDIEVLFITNENGCTTKVQDGYNGLCYHTPTEDKNLFNS